LTQARRSSQLLKARGLRPKKSFGQNFLDDPHILGRIADLCQIRDGTRVVVEIGAGLGSLTAALASAGARVVAIERDRDLVPLLRARFQDVPAVEVLETNALTMDFEALHRCHGTLVVCGNLPYHLTSPLIFRALDHLHTWRRLVVMVQQEVAERMAAEAGSRTYGLISVMLAGRVHVERAMDVPAGAFHPPPKVKSSVVVMVPRTQPLAGSDLPEFRAVARAAFSGRRKTLRNSLKALLGQPERFLASAGINPQARAETLSGGDFGRLARVVHELQPRGVHEEREPPVSDDPSDA
jgi:16S rRNA (adenine1518-N6/adenine1519-N6)-dimethyltransferase